MRVPTKQLPNSTIPVLGLGTYQLDGETCQQAVYEALGNEYTHIDTAEIYGNQHDIGSVIDDEPRGSLFLTSKAWRNHFTHEGILQSTDQTLQELNTDYLDLLLLHWPTDGTDYDAVLRAMKKLVDAGTVKNVGVSNFTKDGLRSILKKAERVGVDIAVNQVEFHPYLYQDDLLAYCEDHNVQLEAYAPLAKGRVTGDDTLKRIADNHEKTPAQVALRWAIQHGAAVIPRSSDPDHIAENINVFNFELTDRDMQRINAIDKHERIYNPPFAEF